MATARPTSSIVGALNWFAVAYAASLVGYIATNAIASRALGPSDFGYFVIFTSITTVIGQLALVGTHRAGLRDAARLQAASAPQIAELRRGSRAVTLVTLPVAGIVAGLAAAGLVTGYDVAHRIVLGVGTALLVVLGGQQKLWANYLRGFGHIRTASLLEGRSGGAAVALTQTALLFAAWQLFPELGLVGLLAVAAVGFLPAVLVAWRLTARHWRQVHTPWQLKQDLHTVLTRNWGFASAQAASYANANLELWIAALLLSSVDTSLFGAADRLVLLLVVPMTSLQIVFSPMVARIATSDPRTTERLLRTGATVATLVTAVLWIPMLIAPTELLTLVYGSEFAGASTALMLLTAGYVANVLSGLSGTVLAMTDREGLVASLTWRAVAARVVLAVPTAGLAGIEGLAASEALVSCILSVVLWRTSRSMAGISTHVTARPSLALARQTAG